MSRAARRGRSLRLGGSIGLGRDASLLIAGQAARAAGYGFTAVLLGALLAERGYGNLRAWVVLTALIAGTALSSLLPEARVSTRRRRRSVSPPKQVMGSRRAGGLASGGTAAGRLAVMGQRRVMIRSGAIPRTDVHGCRHQLRDVVQQPVVRLGGDRMRLDDAEIVVDDDAGLGTHPVPD